MFNDPLGGVLHNACLLWPVDYLQLFIHDLLSAYHLLPDKSDIFTLKFFFFFFLALMTPKSTVKILDDAVRFQDRDT